MSEEDSNLPSLTDWERIDALTDEEIDTTDVPPLSERFFAGAELRLPQPKLMITIRLDQDVVAWFKSQGKGYQTRMNAVLRLYMEEMTSVNTNQDNTD